VVDYRELEQFRRRRDDLGPQPCLVKISKNPGAQFLIMLTSPDRNQREDLRKGTNAIGQFRSSLF